jgi:hypothetical protein
MSLALFLFEVRRAKRLVFWTSPKSFSLSLSAISRRSGCAPAEPYPPRLQNEFREKPPKDKMKKN